MGQIIKQFVDSFTPGQEIPYCQLLVEWTGENETPVDLRHTVDLKGAKGPINYFSISCTPDVPGRYVYAYLKVDSLGLLISACYVYIDYMKPSEVVILTSQPLQGKRLGTRLHQIQIKFIAV